jgi:hypothetical protein
MILSRFHKAHSAAEGNINCRGAEAEAETAGLARTNARNAVTWVRVVAVQGVRRGWESGSISVTEPWRLADRLDVCRKKQNHISDLSAEGQIDRAGQAVEEVGEAGQEAEHWLSGGGSGLER